MSLFTNAFAVDVPETTGQVYEIDPQPSDIDPWQELGRYEGRLGAEVGGSVHRYFRNGQWYLLAIGTDDITDRVRTDDGTALSSLARQDLDFGQQHDREPMLQALRNALEWELTSNRDFWRFGRTHRYYEPEYTDIIDGYRAYDGFEARVRYHDGFYLSADPRTKFVSDKTLNEWIAEIGTNNVEERFRNDRFFFETKDRASVRFVAVSESETVSDDTIPADDGLISIIEYAKRNDFPEDAIDAIDPDEPTVKVKYWGSDRTFSAAPSMLRKSPQENTRRMTQYSAKDADERWTLTSSFIEDIDRLRVYDLTAPVESTPRTAGLDAFDYPELEFGQEGNESLQPGDTFASDRSTTVHPENWARAKTDYLSEYGPRKKPLGSPSIALFYQNDLKADADRAYADVREYFSEYFQIPLPEEPPAQSYDDLDTLQRWTGEYGSETSGALVYLDEYTDQYFDIIEAFEGKAAQQLTHQTYRQARNAGEFSDELYNVSAALATKIGARPYLLAGGLSADAIIGISVTGDEQNTATAVLLDGSNGDLLWQTESRYGTGQKTVAPERIAARIARDSLREASQSAAIESLERVVIHRSGIFGEDEEAAFQAAFDDLDSPDTFEWCVVEVQENAHHRIYDGDRQSRICDTGAYASLDGKTVAVATWAHPLIHQGSPTTILCRIEASEGDFEIEAIGRDVFELSFLNWGAPQMKIKLPISTYLPGEMHTILERCPRLQYPPF